YSVGINILEAHSDAEKIMLASDLADVFKRQTTSWGDQMEVIMQNTIAAFLDSSKGGTILDLRRFLIDGSFRKDFLKTVQDPIIWEYFQYDFPQKRNSSLQSLLSRLQMFFRPKPIRYMLMQQHGLKLGELMDEGAVILIKLSQGLIGESNSYLLGSLILTKFYQAALSRQRMGKEERRPFFIYLDEFQHFITPTLEGILTGARKYGLGLVLAHQSLDQLMKRDGLVGNAVLSNAGTRICFRTSEYDAAQLAKGFSSFDSEDIQQLGIGEAIAKIGSSRHDFNLKTLLPPNLWEEEKRDNYLLTVSLQTEKYGTPITDLEAQLSTYHQHTKPQEPKEHKAKDESSSPPPPSTPDQKEDPPSEQVVEPENIITDPPKLKDIQSAAEKFKQEAKKKEEVSEHRYLQNYVKQMAEARGYLSIIEAPTPDGKGRVDVLLSKGNTQLAVEIAVTTTNKHELGNITKCLKAGYSPIIILSQKSKRLQNIQSFSG
ncbi:MAG: type IV secretory system conjugative DNA transfer family protein, partial [Bacteroidota bacterium]